MSFTDFDKYNSGQIILTDNRLIMNAKKENLFLLAKKDVVVSSGGSLHINVGSKDANGKNQKMIVNAPKIEFGMSDEKNNLESVAKGDSVVESLTRILDKLQKFLEKLSSAKGLVTGGTAELPSINVASVNLINDINQIKADLNKIKSSKTYTT